MAKLFKSARPRHNSLEAYLAQMEAQTVAAYLAIGFNKASPEGTPELRYTKVKTFASDAGSSAGGQGVVGGWPGLGCLLAVTACMAGFMPFNSMQPLTPTAQYCVAQFINAADPHGMHACMQCNQPDR